MTPDLSIVIVNWNGGPLLRRCIESVVRHPPVNSWEIILVDNASTDDSLEWVRKSGLSNLRLIENTENLGFGASCYWRNIGIMLAAAASTCYWAPRYLLREKRLMTLGALTRDFTCTVKIMNGAYAWCAPAGR